MGIWKYQASVVRDATVSADGVVRSKPAGRLVVVPAAAEYTLIGSRVESSWCAAVGVHIVRYLFQAIRRSAGNGKKDAFGDARALRRGRTIHIGTA